MGKEIKIGFIGQGFIGKNYSDDFEERGYEVIRYNRSEYKDNKDLIATCDLVFIAVPTPTTPQGFDDSALIEVLKLVGKGKTAIIKSTMQMGTTRKMQSLYPDIIVMHSPEFLTEKTAAEDARHPNRNIVGIIDADNQDLIKKAEIVISTLPVAPYHLITKAENAEMIKYGGNCWFYFKVVFMNIFYDLISKDNLDFEAIKEALAADPRIGSTHLSVIHQGRPGIEQPGGRGAGGHCFIKDFEAFIAMLDKQSLTEQKKTCEAVRNLNLQYLKNSNKDQDLVKEVYGQ